MAERLFGGGLQSGQIDLLDNSLLNLGVRMGDPGIRKGLLDVRKGFPRIRNGLIGSIVCLPSVRNGLRGGGPGGFEGAAYAVYVLRGCGRIACNVD